MPRSGYDCTGIAGHVTRRHSKRINNGIKTLHTAPDEACIHEKLSKSEVCQFRTALMPKADCILPATRTQDSGQKRSPSRHQTFFDPISGFVGDTPDKAVCSPPRDEAHHPPKRLCRRSNPRRSSTSGLPTAPSNSSRPTEEIQSTLISSVQGTSPTSFTAEQTLNCVSFHDHLTISAQDGWNPGLHNSPGADVAHPAAPLLNDDHEAGAPTLVCFGILSDVKAQIQLDPDTVSRPVEDGMIGFDVAQSKEYSWY